MNREPIKNVPDDFNAEVLLNHYSDETFNVEFEGDHGRNVYMDILSIDVHKGKQLLILGRNSLYNALPEYLFHTVDRFDKPKVGKKDHFQEEHTKQEDEEDKAYHFFRPIDLMLFRLKADVKKSLLKYTNENSIMQNIIGDTLTEKQKRNRFIKRTIKYLTGCKNIRGDRTLITLMLRKVFKDEKLSIDICRKDKDFEDKATRYQDVLGAALDDTYVGFGYTENTLQYIILYWSEEDCNEKFFSFIDEIEEYQSFVQDFFLSVESILEFRIEKVDAPLRLSDTKKFNFLDYNTNL